MTGETEPYGPELPPGLTRVEEIILLEHAGDRCQELAAGRIAAELDAGKSTRVLAAEIGKSKTHVAYMAKSWQLRLSGDGRPFNEIYNSAEVRGPGQQKAVAAAEPEVSPERRAGAVRRLGRIRRSALDARREVLAALMQGISPQRVATELLDGWREFEDANPAGVPADVLAVIRRHVVDPGITAVLAWPGGEYAEKALAEDDELAAAYRARFGEGTVRA